MPHPFPNLPPHQRGTVHCLRHRSAALAGNFWQDPVERDVLVYEPPGEHGPLPAIFVLPAFSGTGEGLLSRGLSDVSIASRIDHLVAQGCPPFYAVLPDAMTRLGGSQYVDSSRLGAYATYVGRELRDFVAERFDLTGRWGAVGRSSGGFGALHLAMTFPGSLHAIASSAGDCGFDLAYLGELGPALSGVQRAGGLERFVSWFWGQHRPPGSAFAALNLLAMSCAYSPNPDARPIPAHLPLNFDTGALDFDVYRSWSAFDPVERVQDAASREALASLDLLWLEAGKRDEYNLQYGTRRLVQGLASHGVDFVHEEFDGGHRGTAWRYDLMLPARNADQGVCAGRQGACPRSHRR